jgi:hypothetical protein
MLSVPWEPSFAFTKNLAISPLSLHVFQSTKNWTQIWHQKRTGTVIFLRWKESRDLEGWWTRLNRGVRLSKAIMLWRYKVVVAKDRSQSSKKKFNVCLERLALLHTFTLIFVGRGPRKALAACGKLLTILFRSSSDAETQTLAPQSINMDNQSPFPSKISFSSSISVTRNATCNLFDLTAPL